MGTTWPDAWALASETWRQYVRVVAPWHQKLAPMRSKAFKTQKIQKPPSLVHKIKYIFSGVK